MSYTTEPQKKHSLAKPILAAVGILALVVVGLVLIIGLATAVALIIGYIALAAAAVFLVYALIARSISKRKNRPQA